MGCCHMVKVIQEEQRQKGMKKKDSKQLYGTQTVETERDTGKKAAIKIKIRQNKTKILKQNKKHTHTE